MKPRFLRRASVSVSSDPQVRVKSHSRLFMCWCCLSQQPEGRTDSNKGLSSDNMLRYFLQLCVFSADLADVSPTALGASLSRGKKTPYLDFGVYNVLEVTDYVDICAENPPSRLISVPEAPRAAENLQL